MGIVQKLLLSESSQLVITPALIEEKIDTVLPLNPEWATTIDRDWIVEELIRRFSVQVGATTLLSDASGHEPWLIPELKRDWRYWRRYQQWQEDNLPWEALEGIDKSTDYILGQLEDPKRAGAWDRRGLVVGHVQSGKTGNYTGLICKAADAGYKIIIVLAGMHNNLRSQTQMRLDEGFLGYETSPFEERSSHKIIGVGKIDSDPSISPQFVTNRSEKGDFSARVANQMGITPEERPWLFVVKKNKSVLTALHKWLLNHVADYQDPGSGRKLVSKRPLLIIDDEADNASVDTGENIIGTDGDPDMEHQPTAINSLIRKILHTFSRKAYVGYTATPFANIFIHEHGKTENEGADLFPAAFIVNLGAPNNYVGPSRVFGTSTPEGRNGGMPLIRIVDDHCSEDGKGGWMPQRHKSAHVPDYDSESALPPSLCEAVDAFFLACAVREVRGQGSKHSSMLVHVTRFNAVQNYVYQNVEWYVNNVRRQLSRKIQHDSVLFRLKNLYESDFVPVSMEIARRDDHLGEINEWQSVEKVLFDVIDQISVRMINGTAKDVLDYADSASGLKVIAIGGDKLARGLTLEGLCTSYFLRASKMYDTLMQMGRWFGYRPGYLDLCRLYTTDELVEWFEHIADASEELREEFDIMVGSGGTPRDYGLKVQSHPTLMVTSRLKMRAAKSLFLSFSGNVVETVSLFSEKEKLTNNLNVFSDFVGAIGAPTEIPPQSRDNGVSQSWNGVLWENISSDKVIGFLDDYETHPKAYKVNNRMISEFISKMTEQNELTTWTVAVIGGGKDQTFGINGFNVRLMKRKRRGHASDRYSIGRLLSPKDEGINLNDQEWSAALEATLNSWQEKNEKNGKEPINPSGRMMRHVRGFGSAGVAPSPEKGLLLIYLLDPVEIGENLDDGCPPIVAFGISFPGSSASVKVEYKVNNVMWEQEYGASE
ncbi:MAG: Z1 domain-containing protein [Candidatus Marinimicrobia bacterium]|nr:Z1 domain-containing protein [Candidatus Neomarinimicrobiota bacterium]MBT4946492.1 Z1 domain-containing protein [Candidatus Neomarinimicrobiota bacterium]MBT5270570.1 Z1 domain-containing protein [Candidatus Neomarinimicrobiota bacterium]